jgi:hypothetical protein
MKKHELNKIIQEIADQSIPLNHDVWPGLRDKLASQKSHRTRIWFFPSSRLGRLAFALSIILLISITVYASEPGIFGMLGRDSRFKNVDLSVRHPLNLSKTIDDVTITLDWVYADKDWVLIGYKLRSSDGLRYEPIDRMLTVDDGVILPWQDSYSFLSQYDYQEGATTSGESSHVGIFENLSVSMALATYFEVEAQSFPNTFSEVAPSEKQNDGKTVILTPIQPGRIVGPYRFEFLIPEVFSADISKGN